MIGEIAPFFLKRVLGLEVRNGGAWCEVDSCPNCLFVQTTQPFTQDALAKLYIDYRQESYNRERIRYEPAYAELATKLGISEQERTIRVAALSEWLGIEISGTMLDYGGGDGRFLPNGRGPRFVFDSSTASPIAGVTKATAPVKCDYLQAAHILEHVSFPRETLKEIAGLVNPGGMLYIEVPQELSDGQLDNLSRGRGFGLPIHEHINFYCPTSVQRLMEAANLTIEKIERCTVNPGWGEGTIIRALARC